MTPIALERPVLRLREMASGWESRADIAAKTRSLRFGLTTTDSLMTAETVEVETPASRATSRIVYFALSAILIDLRASAFDDSSIIHNVAIEKYSLGPVSRPSPLQASPGSSQQTPC